MAKLENELSWSVSRDNLFRTCERAYYYQYYGSWGGWEREAPERVRQLYLLKNLQTLPMWAGGLVHQAIAEALNRFARANASVSAGELQARARAKLRAGWLEAVNREWERTPKKTNLQELYYGNGKTLPEAETERVKDRVYGALDAFAASAVLKEVLTTPYMNWKPVDQLDSFMLEGLKVWCAIDFAYTDPTGILRILDWKTGAESRDGLQLQLACYAFFAAERWFVPVENTRLFGVFLAENARLSEYRTEPEALLAARETILTSAAAMRAKLRNVTANIAAEEDFACSTNPRVCARCNFREVCPQGQSCNPL